MTRGFRSLLAMAIMVLIASSPVASNPLEDAANAIDNADYTTVLSKLLPLADRGEAVAQMGLGYLYFNGKGVPQNFDEAVKWYRLAADQGEPTAQFSLGQMYSNGSGMPQNFDEAVKWYRLAADQGQVSAQTNLGVLYFNGKGVKRDLAAALKWYRLAADQGEETAQYNLGRCYFNGEGVPQDFVRAHMWFNLAASRGHENAMRDRNVAARRMTPAQIGEAQSLASSWKPVVLQPLVRFSTKP